LRYGLSALKTLPLCNLENLPLFSLVLPNQFRFDRNMRARMRTGFIFLRVDNRDRGNVENLLDRTSPLAV